MMRVALAALVFLCAAWAASVAPDDSGPFIYLEPCGIGSTPSWCATDGMPSGWWPVNFLKMIQFLEADIKLPGPPNDAPDLWVLYNGGDYNTVNSLPAEIGILAIDYDGDEIAVGVDLDGPSLRDPSYLALPAELVDTEPGDAEALVSSLVSEIEHLALVYGSEDLRARHSLWFVSPEDLSGMAATASIAVTPGLEPGRYHFLAEASDGQTDRSQVYSINYDPKAEEREPLLGPVPDPEPNYVPVLLATGAVALLALPRLPAGQDALVRYLDGRSRYAIYCTAIGAAWFAASAVFSAQSGWISNLDNIMMLPASLVMMGSPVAYYVVSRPPMGARRGPARTAASVALMALGLWSAFYVLYGIPSALLAISFVALLPAAGCCLGAALFWAGFRRACRWPGQALDSRDGFDTQGQSGLLEQGK